MDKICHKKNCQDGRFSFAVTTKNQNEIFSLHWNLFLANLFLVNTVKYEQFSFKNTLGDGHRSVNFVNVDHQHFDCVFWCATSVLILFVLVTRAPAICFLSTFGKFFLQCFASLLCQCINKTKCSSAENTDTHQLSHYSNDRTSLSFQKHGPDKRVAGKAEGGSFDRR